METTTTREQPIQLPQLLTRAEVADLLRVSPKTLANWRSQGIGPRAISFGRGHVRYFAEDVDEYIANLHAEAA